MEKYTCFQFFPNSKQKVLIGTNSGKLITCELYSETKIQRLKERETKKFTNVLNLKTLSRIGILKGEIRSIDILNDDEFVIASKRSEIVLFNIKEEKFFLINNYSFSNQDIIWRMMVIDSDHFITAGYNKIILWEKLGRNFISQTLFRHKNALFCLSWYDKESKKIFLNSYDGASFILDFSTDVPSIMKKQILDYNLQDFKKYNEIFYSTNYSGNILFYNELQHDGMLYKIDDYSFNPTKGNSVNYSIELDSLLIGKDSGLYIFNSNLTTINQISFPSIQIENLKKFDIVLTPHSIVSPNYNDLEKPPITEPVRAVKIALVGDSQAGKTTFCSFLDTGKADKKIDSSFGRHLWMIPFYHDSSRMLNIIDLAGQKEEHFTYFPTIYDSDYVLIFFQAIRSDTFDHAIKYYDELKNKCPNAKFLFIQTFSNQKTRNKKIIKNFKNREISPDENLIIIDLIDEFNLEDIETKFLNLINWDKYDLRNNSNLYKNFYQIVHGIYIKGKSTKYSIDDFVNIMNMPTKLVKSFTRYFYRLGLIEYIESNQEILINDEEYTDLQSEIAQTFDAEDGIISISDFNKEFMKFNKNYLDNIIDYYKKNEFLFETQEFLFVYRFIQKKNLEIDYSYYNIKFKLNKGIKLGEMKKLFNIKDLKIENIFRNYIVLQNQKNKNYSYLEFEEEMDNEGIVSGIFYYRYKPITKSDILIKNNLINILKKDYSDIVEHIPPVVFISYSWIDGKPDEWVEIFANKLLNNRVNIILDIYDFKEGDNEHVFITKNMNIADYIFIIASPIYKEKAESFSGGVGRESIIISSLSFNQFPKKIKNKIQVIIKEGDKNTSIPLFLKGIHYYSLSEAGKSINKKQYENNEEFERILRFIHGNPDKIKPDLIS